MKRKYFIISIFVLLSVFLNAQEHLLDKEFYYYKGEKFYLEVDYSRISVVSEGKLNVDNIQKVIDLCDFSINKEGKSYTRQIIVPIDDISELLSNIEIYITEIEFSEIRNQTDYYDIIRQFSKVENVVKTMPGFTVSYQKLGISNNFYVKLFREEDKNILLELAEQYAVQVLGYNEFMPLWFTLSCNRNSSLSVIEAANLFYETGLFESTEPELLHHNLQASNDPYFSDQWGLKNTGQHCDTSGIDIRAEDAWSITAGSSDVIVAVFDHGIKMNHPDLANNIYGTGYDAETNMTPSVLRGDHGTPCAGIVAAEQNNIGISGVAPNCKLMSISINLSWGNTPQQFANGFNWAWQHGADVISNSWGGYAPSNIMDNAINVAATQGRNGLGCIMVFCTQNWDFTVAYPATLQNVIAVGAITPNGERKSAVSCDGNEDWGSNYGIALDVVAPGVFIPTTTWTGGYRLDFYATSAACPHVAGVAALILSVNPNLTQQQVRDIIESTCQKVGGYHYDVESGRPNGTWHEEMGYGLVDAHAAVVLALQSTCYNINSGMPIVNGTITQNTTWSTPVHVSNSVTVPNGITLTITDTVKCDKNAFFIVEPGGKLIINCGTLTNACPDQLWQGITVLGNPNQPLFSNQGSVQLNNGATIENAVCGIAVQGGGYVKANNAQFVNNINNQNRLS